MFHRDKSAWHVFSNTGSSATFLKSFLRKSSSSSSSLSLSSFFSSSSSSSTPSPLTLSSGWLDNVHQKMEGLFLSEREAKSKGIGNRQRLGKLESEVKDKEVESGLHVSWKHLYLQHHFEDLMAVPAGSAKKSSDSRIGAMGKNLGNPKEKILFFGEGSNPTAKNMLYSMMWNDQCPFEFIGLYPGKEGIGSGVGFHVGGRDISFVALHLSKYGLRLPTEKEVKAEGQENEESSTTSTSEGEDNDKKPKDTVSKNAYFSDSVTPEIWKQFFDSVNGLIYVLEADEFALQEAAERLQGFLKMLSAKAAQGSTSTRDPPLLVLLCEPKLKKQEEEGTSNILTPAELAECLVFGEVQHRSWAIRRCYSDTLEGVAEGVHWLVRNMPLPQ